MFILPITTVRAARAELRKQGMTTAELVMLEEIALQMRDGRMRVLRGAYLARGLGISPQRANTLLRRLVELGLIVRFKTGLIRLNIENLRKNSVMTYKAARRKVSNWLKDLNKARRRTHPARNRETNTILGPVPRPETHSPDEIEAFWLRNMGL